MSFCTTRRPPITDPDAVSIRAGVHSGTPCFRRHAPHCLHVFQHACYDRARSVSDGPELDKPLPQAVRRIVSVIITPGPSPLPGGVFDQAPRVIATLDDGREVELFSFYEHERSFAPGQFVGLTVDEGRRLKFAPGNRLDMRQRSRSTLN